MKLNLLPATIAFTLATGAFGQAPTDNKAPLADRFDSLHRMVKPAADEARWSRVQWMPSTDIWAARKKAAAEGKPLFLWYMAGEPLGTC